MSEAALSRISNLIKVEDDLSKIESLRQQFSKEKQAIDVKLHSTTQEQIESIVQNFDKLRASATKLGHVHSNIERINTIYEESVLGDKEYETFRNVTVAHETMMQVQNLYTDIANFRSYLEHIDNMVASELEQVSADIDYPLYNVYRIHFNVTQARNFQEYLEEQSRTFSDDTQSIIRKIIGPTRSTVRGFDDLLKEIIVSATEAVKEGNHSMVTKLVRIIEFEVAEDTKLILLDKLNLISEDNKKTLDYSSYRGGPRHYKKFFYDKLEESLNDTFQKCLQHFEADPMLVFENLDWLEDELIFVKRTFAALFPPHWSIDYFIIGVYYNLLHDFSIKLINSSPPAEDLMVILNYDANYSTFLKSLEDGKPSEKVKTSILGEELKESVLEDYMKVIVSKMKEWNDRLIQEETTTFINRSEPPDNYSYSQTLEDIDQFDHAVSFEVMTDVYVLPDFKTTLSMFKEQADVAADSGYGKVLVGVIESWSESYNERVANYVSLIEDEMLKYMSVYNNDRYLIQESKTKKFFQLAKSKNKTQPEYDVDNMTPEELAEISRAGIVEYLVALGNTYEINNEKLHDKFLPKYVSKVHTSYQERIAQAFDNVTIPGMDLNALVIRSVVDIILNDLSPALSSLFTSKWYENERIPNSGEQNIAQRIVETIGEYMEDLKGYATYEIYSLTFTVLLDSFISSYLRIGYQSILHGSGKKIDPSATKKSKSFGDALNRDIGIIYEGLDHLFSRKDAIYLVKSLSALEFLIAIATCENIMEDVTDIWEHEVLETYYDCSVEFVRGALECRKDTDTKQIAPLIDQLSEIKVRYQETTPAPELQVVTLNNFSYT